MGIPYSTIKIEDGGVVTIRESFGEGWEIYRVLYT